MLEQMMQSDLRGLNFGVRDHARILGQDAVTCRAVFEAHDYTCHVCGIRSVEGMEIDHGSRHQAGVSSGLKPICQFCHNLKHPLWAAARGRITPIWAPDISQQDLTRLAWAMVAWREVHPESFDVLRSDLLVRVQDLSEALGSFSAEGLFEAAFAAHAILGPEKGRSTMRRIDQALRFVPSEILLEPDQISDTSLDQASRLSTWTIGGFRKIARMAGRSILTDLDPAALEAFDAACMQTDQGDEDDD